MFQMSFCFPITNIHEDTFIRTSIFIYNCNFFNIPMNTNKEKPFDRSTNDSHLNSLQVLPHENLTIPKILNSQNFFTRFQGFLICHPLCIFP